MFTRGLEKKDVIANPRRRNSRRPEPAIAPQDIQTKPHEKDILSQSKEAASRVAQDVAELKDYVRVSYRLRKLYSAQILIQC